MTYYLISAQEGREVESISTQSVRYRLDDPFVLQQDLSQLIPSPRSGQAPDAEEGMAERARTRLAEARADQDEFSGPPLAESRIWRVWNSLQSTHYEDREDTLMSDEADIRLDPEHRFRDTGANMFEQAVGKLRTSLDRDLLTAGGHPSLWAEVEVVSGAHAGRTGSVSAVNWQADHEQRTIGPEPESLAVRFDDLYESLDIATGDLRELPQWDRTFVVVHAGESFPKQWTASLLLADADAKSLWRQDALDALRTAWTGVGRLVVFIPCQEDGSSMSDEHQEWAAKAVSRADEIVAHCPAGASDPMRLGLLADTETAAVRERLVLLVPGGDPDPSLHRWLERHPVPVAGSGADATAIVLKRIGRGRERKGGEREVPLLVARTTGYYAWSSALREGGKSLVGADIQWIHSDEHTGDTGPWWSMRARIRHADHRITSELLVCHAMVTSVVAYRRRERWTDCEIVLTPCDNSLSSIPVRNAPKGLALQLPTITTEFSGGDNRARAVAGVLGIDSIEPDRLRSHGGRNDSSLLAAQRGVAVLELTEEELTALRSQNAESAEAGAEGKMVVFRLADLLAEPICDWATVGAVTRAVMPAWPPISGDFYTGRM
ncbi:hypothetical protein O1L55_40665 [Streptomyces albulus]|nr:hypothetical protein [Streptomyces noursei]